MLDDNNSFEEDALGQPKREGATETHNLPSETKKSDTPPSELTLQGRMPHEGNVYDGEFYSVSHGDSHFSKLKAHSYGQMDDLVHRIHQVLAAEENEQSDQAYAAVRVAFTEAAKANAMTGHEATPEAQIQQLKLAEQIFSREMQGLAAQVPASVDRQFSRRDLVLEVLKRNNKSIHDFEVMPKEEQDAVVEQSNALREEKIAAIIKRLDLYQVAVTQAIDHDLAKRDEELRNRQGQRQTLLSAVLSGVFSGTSQNKSGYKDNLSEAIFAGKTKAIDQNLAEIQKNIGNPIWEAEHGQKLAQQIYEDMDFVERAVKDNPHRFDKSEVESAMHNSRVMMDDIAGSAKDEGFKKVMEDMAKRVADVISSMFSKMFRKFGS